MMQFSVLRAVSLLCTYLTYCDGSGNKILIEGLVNLRNVLRSTPPNSHPAHHDATGSTQSNQESTSGTNPISSTHRFFQQHRPPILQAADVRSKDMYTQQFHDEAGRPIRAASSEQPVDADAWNWQDEDYSSEQPVDADAWNWPDDSREQPVDADAWNWQDDSSEQPVDADAWRESGMSGLRRYEGRRNLHLDESEEVEESTPKEHLSTKLWKMLIDMLSDTWRPYNCIVVGMQDNFKIRDTNLLAVALSIAGNFARESDISEAIRNMEVDNVLRHDNNRHAFTRAFISRNVDIDFFNDIHNGYINMVLTQKVADKLDLLLPPFRKYFDASASSKPAPKVDKYRDVSVDNLLELIVYLLDHAEKYDHIITWTSHREMDQFVIHDLGRLSIAWSCLVGERVSTEGLNNKLAQLYEDKKEILTRKVRADTVTNIHDVDKKKLVTFRQSCNPSLGNYKKKILDIFEVLRIGVEERKGGK